MKNYKLIVISILILAIVLRVILLFFSPITMFTDGVINYLPSAEKVLNFDFSFHPFPLFVIIEAFWMLLFSGNMLWFMWKATSFIFFIAILLLFPQLFRKFKLNIEEKIIILALFLFSTWSLLLSATVMQEMLLTFLTISLFLVVEKYFEKQNKILIFFLVLLSFLICLTKASSYILLAGFGLYILVKRKKDFLKKKIHLILYLVAGTILSAFWPIKNYLILGNAFVYPAPPPAQLHSFVEYVKFYIESYHYLWEIPIFSKVSLSGILGSLFNIYYVVAIVVTLLFLLITIFALFRYGKRKKEYLLLILPMLIFAFIFEPIFFSPASPNIGRYSFPLWIFLFFFCAKFIANLKNKNAKKICYIIISLFCIISIISAFGITIYQNNINSQIVEMSERLKEENLENSTIISNNEFAGVSIYYYLKRYPVKLIVFNLSKNIMDPNVECQGDKFFELKNFEIFHEGEEYRICKK